MKRTLQIGERVRIHPASDWFMRGVTHAVVTCKRTNRAGDTVYILRPDTTGIYTPKRLRVRLTRDLLMADGDL